MLVCLYYVDRKRPEKKYHKLNLYKSCYINNNASDRCIYPGAFSFIRNIAGF